jgi:hypothetical protein
MTPKLYLSTEVAAFYGDSSRHFDAGWYFVDEHDKLLHGPFRSSLDCTLALHYYRLFLDVPRGRTTPGDPS